MSIAKMRENIEVELEIPRSRGRQEPQPSAFHVRFTYPIPDVAAKVTQQLGVLFVEQNTQDRGGAGHGDQRVPGVAAGRVAGQARGAGAASRGLPPAARPGAADADAVEHAGRRRRAAAGAEPRRIDGSRPGPQVDARAAVSRSRERAAGARAGRCRAAPTLRPRARRPQQQLAAARAKLAALELRYKPNHPDVVRARRLVAELEPKAAAEAAAATRRRRPRRRRRGPDRSRSAARACGRCWRRSRASIGRSPSRNPKSGACGAKSPSISAASRRCPASSRSGSS